MRKCLKRATSLGIFIGVAGLLGSPAVLAADHAPVLPSIKSRSPRIDHARPSEVPDDTTLESAQAKIGTVRFKALQLFDIGGRDSDSAMFRLGNRLHIRTRESTLADQLLFREGDAYDASTIAESARI